MLWLSYLPPFALAMYSIQISIGTCSCCCGLINIFLIYHMKVWNQFILLILNLAVSQLIFDVCPYFSFCDPNKSRICYSYVFNFFTIYMGIVVTLWTNIIIIVLYSSIIYFRPNIVKDNFNTIFVIIHGFGLLTGILSITPSNFYVLAIEVIYYFYVSFRLLSIVFNGIVIGLIYKEIQYYDTDHPALELINRLIYYPIVQIITLIPSMWFEFASAYKVNSTGGDDYINSTSTAVKVSWFLQATFYFSAGIGFFIVFLKVQPNAYEVLISFFGFKNTENDGSTIDYYNNSSRFTNTTNSKSITTAGGSKSESSKSKATTLSNQSIITTIINGHNLTRMSDLELVQIIIDKNNNNNNYNSHIGQSTLSELHK